MLMHLYKYATKITYTFMIQSRLQISSDISNDRFSDISLRVNREKLARRVFLEHPLGYSLELFYGVPNHLQKRGLNVENMRTYRSLA